MQADLRAWEEMQCTTAITLNLCLAELIGRDINSLNFPVGLEFYAYDSGPRPKKPDCYHACEQQHPRADWASVLLIFAI